MTPPTTADPLPTDPGRRAEMILADPAAYFTRARAEADAHARAWVAEQMARRLARRRRWRRR